MDLSLRNAGKDEATLKSKERPHSVSVVVCTRHRAAFLQSCLVAVNSLDPRPDGILVVDNSEGNNDTRKVAEDHGARYTIEPVRGLSRARNRGLMECDTDIVAFLDDDATPEPDWLGSRAAAAQSEMARAWRLAPSRPSW